MWISLAEDVVVADDHDDGSVVVQHLAPDRIVTNGVELARGAACIGVEAEQRAACEAQTSGSGDHRVSQIEPTPTINRQRCRLLNGLTGDRVGLFYDEAIFTLGQDQSRRLVVSAQRMKLFELAP